MLKIWVPYISVGTGADIMTRSLAAGLRKRGCEVVEQAFPHYFETAPWLLRSVAPPPGAQVILTNTWSGFAFARPGARMIAIDHLFVLDSALEPYKSILQRFYHNILIRQYIIASTRAADAVVAVSDYTANSFAQKLSLPRPKVILNGVDTTFFTPAPAGKPPLHGRPVHLLYVGNLSRRKGSDLLAPIMERLGDNYQLYYTSGLRDSTLEHGLSNIHPLGRLDHHQIREQYRTADLLLFPSRGEGLPLTVMESMACGTPVVAAEVSSLPEAVTREVGRLCPVNDITGFVEAIRELTSNPKRLNAMNKLARDRAQQMFAAERMVEEYLNFIKTVTIKLSTSKL